jgi:hypothetical protein
LPGRRDTAAFRPCTSTTGQYQANESVDASTNRRDRRPRVQRNGPRSTGRPRR